MLDRLDEADQLALVGGQLGVVGHHGAAEEGNRAGALVKNSTDACAGGIAVDDERGGEVRQLQGWLGDEGRLERQERLSSGRRPQEGLAFEQGCQRSSDGAVVLDEAPVVAGEAEEATERLDLARLWPCLNNVDLGRVHGDTRGGDDVAKVRDTAFREAAL